MKKRTPYTQINKKQNQLINAQNEYQETKQDITKEIADILQIPQQLIQLVIHQHMEQQPIHELTIQSTKNTPPLTLKTLKTLSQYLNTEDLEITPYKDKTILTYKVSHHNVTYTEKDNINLYVDYPPEKDII